jgi:hypothetical protein
MYLAEHPDLMKKLHKEIWDRVRAGKDSSGATVKPAQESSTSDEE